MNRSTGKTVLVTGGTSGMGLATAHRLVADAADLGAVDALMETVRERRAAHAPARTEPTEGRGLPHTGNDLVIGGVRS
ncbi:hypothetical protein ACIBG6_08300 [Streptomyces sp. NPDC050842]|uniref:hypothetical protein n=1 Tax=Streptomyces sp. NPDC050842 TaxID=3365636 RepID=UPI00379E02F0